MLRKIITRIRQSIMRRYRLFTEHVKYSLETNGQTIIIKSSDFKLKNPRLICKHGPINARVTKQNRQFIFEFTMDDIPFIDAISSELLISDGNHQYHFSSFIADQVKNYSRVYAVFYSEDFVYFFRNTGSQLGRLILQKKPRTHFESEKYEQRIEKIYQQTRNSPNDKILLYEKFANKFEESASILFERIYHYPNVYYVLDRFSPQYPEIKAKYQDKIVSPDEDKFLELLFTASHYIGTELPIHMVSLRTPYQRLRTEILKTDQHKFIFLQHGVMYALSLKPLVRKTFKKFGIHAPYKVIISSELEAEHLIALGGYKREDLWKTGLATFDGKRINKDADKISVMLTWRPWDEQKNNFEETTYYQAVKSIVDSIDDKSKLQLLLHPKVLETIAPNNQLLKYKYDGLIDDALNQTKVLISDYSSVTFDGFYRGINVVFWWVEKDECLRRYNNDLLLTEENIFGDIAYNNSDLNQLVIKNSSEVQNQKYIERYRKIVEFNDDQNTERIIAKLKQENII